jgi:cell division protein FtsN
MPPSGVRVRLQGYPARPRRTGSPARSLGVMALIVIAVGATLVFRHVPRGAGEGKPASGSGVSKPQRRVSAPLSLPSPAASPALAVPAKPAAPAASGPRPDGKVNTTAAPSTSTHPVTKAANSTTVTGSASKVAPGASLTGAPPTLHAGGRRYHVQVGAFGDKQAAEELTTRLRALGYAARIVGAQPFLVLVGGYLDEPTASRLVSHLRGQGFDAVLVSANAPQ